MRDRPTGAPPDIPARAVSPIRVPPSDWVPGRVRAAAAALPYADGRSMNRAAAAAPKARPIVYAERSKACPIVYAERPKARPIVYAERPKARPIVYAERDRSLPPRREEAHRSPSSFGIHLENAQFVWSYLERRWVPRSQVASALQGARSRSPPPGQFWDARGDPYRVNW